MTDRLRRYGPVVVGGLLRPVLCDDEGRWTADYVRLRFRARRGP